MDLPANKGALLLRERLEAHGARAALAKSLEVGPDLVSRWLSGERVPNTLHRRRLEDEYGISWRLWDDAVDAANGDAA
jgi:transcriptional regulator with XRE-family HTH domain